MAMTAAASALLTFVSLSLADTVHFTNSPTQIERTLNSQASDGRKLLTYQLQVPGSVPITIIEAQEQTNEPPKTKDYIVPGSTYENNDANTTNHEETRCFGPSCHDITSDGRKKYVYAPDLLEKFLNEYAERIKNADQQTKNNLNRIGVITNEYTKKIGSFSDKVDVESESAENEDKSYHYGYNRYEQKRPSSGNKGWVTLEAVPWSTSKVSKWKPNKHYVKKPVQSWDEDSDYSSQDYEIKRPKPRPTIINNRPNFQYDIQETEEPQKPSWVRPYKPSNDWMSDDSRKPNCDQHTHTDYKFEESIPYFDDRHDLITDDRPSRFPSSTYQHLDTPLRRPTKVVYSDYERDGFKSNHPSNGDGEWVLLSSTKGYHVGNKRQRSLNFSPSALTKTQSVQLTVLPGDSKVNTTTSHGGMLEVEKSFHSVDESKRIHDREMKKLNSTHQHKPLSLRRAKISTATTSGPDSTAVLAAVGAGMLPATMAMVMPMMLGRRKRSTRLYTYSTVTQSATRNGP